MPTVEAFSRVLARTWEQSYGLLHSSSFRRALRRKSCILTMLLYCSRTWPWEIDQVGRPLGCGT